MSINKPLASRACSFRQLGLLKLWPRGLMAVSRRITQFPFKVEGSRGVKDSGGEARWVPGGGGAEVGGAQSEFSGKGRKGAMAVSSGALTLVIIPIA